MTVLAPAFFNSSFSRCRRPASIRLNSSKRSFKCFSILPWSCTCRSVIRLAPHSASLRTNAKARSALSEKSVGKSTWASGLHAAPLQTLRPFSPFSRSRSTSTGLVALWIAALATPPSRISLAIVPPVEPTTTREQSCSSAWRLISICGNPSTILAVTRNPRSFMSSSAARRRAWPVPSAGRPESRRRGY